MGLGLMGTLGIGVSGLQTNQAGINVSGHNIANAATDGYSMQRVDVKTNTPYCVPGMNSVAGAGQYGTGSHIESVTRVRNTFLDYQIRNESSNLGMYTVKMNYLSQIQGMFEEPSDSGLNALMTKFFTAWTNYTNGTNNDIGNVVSTSSTLADDLNHTYSQLQKLKSDIKQVQKQSVIDINQTLDQIDNLNQQIMQVKISGQQPNDLEDSRDLLLDQLSAQFGIDVDKTPRFDGQDLIPQETNGLENPKLVKSLGKDDVKRFSCVTSVVPTPGAYVSGDGTGIVKLKDGNGAEVSISASNLPTHGNPVVLDSTNKSGSGGMYDGAASVELSGDGLSYELKDGSGNTLATLTKDSNGKLHLASQLYAVTYNKLGSQKNSESQSTIYIRMNANDAKDLDENRILWADKSGNAISDDKNGKNTLLKDDGTIYSYSDIKVFKPTTGTIAGTSEVQKNIDSYTNQLNKLAKTIALAMNAVESGMNNPNPSSPLPASQSGKTTPDKDYIPYFINSDYIKQYSNAYNSDGTLNVSGTNGYYSDANEGQRNWEDYITAGNIAVNKDLINNSSKLKVRSTDDQFKDPQENISGGQDKSRALAISKLQSTALNIQSVDPNCYSREDFVKSLTADSNGVKTITDDANGIKIGDYFRDLTDDYGIKCQQATRMQKNETKLLNSIKDQKASVSGVSLDEEMTKLIQYQHGYQANAKVISTVSQLLDVVIGLVR